MVLVALPAAIARTPAVEEHDPVCGVHRDWGVHVM